MTPSAGSSLPGVIALGATFSLPLDNQLGTAITIEDFKRSMRNEHVLRVMAVSRRLSNPAAAQDVFQGIRTTTARPRSR